MGSGQTSDNVMDDHMKKSTQESESQDFKKGVVTAASVSLDIRNFYIFN